LEPAGSAADNGVVTGTVVCSLCGTVNVGVFAR
jgi:hypothetical protein